MAGTSPWTKEKTDELVRLWVVEKLSGSVIAQRLGLNDRNAVLGKVHRLGLKRDQDVAPPSATSPEGNVPPATVSATHQADPASHESRIPAAKEMAVPKMRLPEQVAAEEPTSPGHPVMSLKERSCRWPVGDPRSPTFRFCCRVRKAGSPYCTEHAAAAYQVPDRSPRPPSNPKRGFGRAA